MYEIDASQDHQRFREFCALAQAGALSFVERLELDRHLASCASCRCLCREYAALNGDGMASLAANEEMLEAAEQWDDRGVRRKLQDAIHVEQSPRVAALPAGGRWGGRFSFPSSLWLRTAGISIAACALLAALLGAYRMGERAHHSPLRAQAPVAEPAVQPQKPAAAGAQTAQLDMLARLDQQLTLREEELAHLRSEVEAAQQQVSQMTAANGVQSSDLKRLMAERDSLTGELAEKQKAWDLLQADDSALRDEHTRSLVETAALNAEVTTLEAANRSDEAHLNDDQQYLSADRDIRELMGARKLYIADVFDVDSSSRTQKPYGRVFYTQNKSLVFYAFDLDHQPGVRSASVFQVWGERDGEKTAKSSAMSLGILYMDSETNRRWVLRSDDPKQLAEIDAVFVTLEPGGGSSKPTGKPLLYALLRKEVNHP